jgi:hypothetical protein
MAVTQLLFLLLGFLSPGEKEFRIVEDLKPQWKIVGQPSTHKAVHIPIDLSQAKGNYILIESKKDFYGFINTAFAFKGHRKVLNADSLIRKHSNTIFLSIYQKDGIEDLSMYVVSLKPIDDLFNPGRPASTFSNFLLAASLILILFFTTLFRTNPQLTLDYLNVIKLFYLRDREENQITLRITSSVNLLFYLFCSLLASLALITAARFSNEGLSFLMRSTLPSASQYLARWIVLALVILGLLMAKFVFASMLALLYNWRDVAGFQFFNFVRVLILSLACVALVGTFCFSFGIDINYFKLLEIGCLLLAIGTGLLYFKLLTRASFHSFHLFSYLCATEIFPLVILIKLLLF